LSHALVSLLVFVAVRLLFSRECVTCSAAVMGKSQIKSLTQISNVSRTRTALMPRCGEGALGLNHLSKSQIPIFQMQIFHGQISNKNVKRFSIESQDSDI